MCFRQNNLAFNVPFFSSAAVPLPLVVIVVVCDGVVGGQAARGRRLSGKQRPPRAAAAAESSGLSILAVVCVTFFCSFIVLKRARLENFKGKY